MTAAIVENKTKTSRTSTVSSPLSNPSPGTGLTAFCNEGRCCSHSTAMVNNLRPRVKSFPAYLEQIRKAIKAEQDPAKLAELQQKLESQAKLYESYKKQLTEYEKYCNSSTANMNTLDRDQNVFRTVNRPIKSLYTIDDESLVRYQKYKKNQNPDYDIDKPTEAEPFTFSLNKINQSTWQITK